MSLFKWSKTAGSNDTADSTIDWQENMSPAGVNNSGRAMMAAVAKYRDDISGALNTSGSSTAYTINPTNQQFTSLGLMANAMIVFVPHTTSGNTCTLNVDALGAKPLRTAPGVEVTAGMLIAGTPYAATYNNTSGVWYLQNIIGEKASVLPIGAIVPYAGGIAPNSSYALCFGQSLAGASFTTLRDILAAASPTFPYGGNAANFNIPDLRGRVPAGKDNMGGTAAGWITTVDTGAITGTIVGTTLGSKGGAQSHVQVLAEIATHSHTITDEQHSHQLPLNASLGLGTVSTGAPGIVAFASSTQDTNTSFTGITGTNPSGSNQPMAWLQPTIILNYIIRVL